VRRLKERRLPELPFGSPELAAAYDGLSDPQFTHGTELLGLLEVGPGDHVLDIGCGTGRLAVAALERIGAEGRIAGIDPASPRIDVARRYTDPRLDFRVGVAEDLSQFADASFDVAYLNSVLNWIRDRAQALREAYRVLKPGGRLGIGTTVRDRPNELRLLARRAWKAARGKGDAQAPVADDSGRTGDGSRNAATEGEIRELLASAGFVSRSIELRNFTSRFRDVAQIVDFIQATNYGQLAPGVDAGDQARFRDALETLLAREHPVGAGGEGIRLERYVLLARADKPV
jgi:SAM-dependent methyltransferase